MTFENYKELVENLPKVNESYSVKISVTDELIVRHSIDGYDIIIRDINTCLTNPKGYNYSLHELRNTLLNFVEVDCGYSNKLEVKVEQGVKELIKYENNIIQIVLDKISCCENIIGSVSNDVFGSLYFVEIESQHSSVINFEISCNNVVDKVLRNVFEICGYSNIGESTFFRNVSINVK